MGIDMDYTINITEGINFNTGFSYIYGEDMVLDIPIIHMPAPTIRSGLNYQKEFWNVNLSNTTTFEQSRFPDNNFDITQWHHYAGTYDGVTLRF